MPSSQKCGKQDLQARRPRKSRESRTPRRKRFVAGCARSSEDKEQQGREKHANDEIDSLGKHVGKKLGNLRGSYLRRPTAGRRRGRCEAGEDKGRRRPGRGSPGSRASAHRDSDRRSGSHTWRSRCRRWSGSGARSSGFRASRRLGRSLGRVMAVPRRAGARRDPGAAGPAGEGARRDKLRLGGPCFRTGTDRPWS